MSLRFLELLYVIIQENYREQAERNCRAHHVKFVLRTGFTRETQRTMPISEHSCALYGFA